MHGRTVTKYLLAAFLASFCAFGTAVLAAEGKPSAITEPDPGTDLDQKKSEDLKQLAPHGNVWLDAKNKRLIVLADVCLREGALEMFACLKGTKEHESIVAVPTQAYVVHAGLVALGAQPGSPARFRPAYQPASGPIVDIYLFWTDEKGKRHQARAQDWIRNVKTRQAMTENWVFAGSGFWKDEESGKEFYKAEEGDFICISNFTSAMLDLPIHSTQSDDALLFTALTDNIPPLGTKVTMVLKPRPAKDDKTDAKKPAAEPNSPSTPTAPVVKPAAPRK